MSNIVDFVDFAIARLGNKKDGQSLPPMLWLPDNDLENIREGR